MEMTKDKLCGEGTEKGSPLLPSGQYILSFNQKDKKDRKRKELQKIKSIYGDMLRCIFSEKYLAGRFSRNNRFPSFIGCE